MIFVLSVLFVLAFGKGYNMFIIDNEIELISENEVAQYIIDNLDNDIYDDMLDECYPMIEFGSLSYYPSVALERLDPIAYRCGMNDYYDSLYSDIVYELERMDYNDTNSFYGFDVELIDEDEDEDED